MTSRAKLDASCDGRRASGQPSVRGFALRVGFCLVVTAVSGCAFPSYRFLSESCSNGIDDDGDGLVDCADPNCSDDGWQCVPAVPSPWLGPVAFWSGESAEAFPGCSEAGGFDGSVVETLRSEPAYDPLTCPDCSCDGALDDEVRSANVRFASSSAGECAFPAAASCPAELKEGCNAYVVQKAQLQKTLLDRLAEAPSSGIALLYTVTGATVSGGTCKVIETGVQGEPGPIAAKFGRVCGANEPTGQCSNTARICGPPLDGSKGFNYCIYQEGASSSCPSGWSVKQPSFYRNLDDGRACAPCTCGAIPTSVDAASATVNFHGSDSSCMSGPTMNAIWPGGGETGSTQFLKGSPDSETVFFKVSVTAKPSTRSCDLVQSGPTGAVLGTEPITLCCLAK